MAQINIYGARQRQERAMSADDAMKLRKIKWHQK
jgi:hypothetical protein